VALNPNLPTGWYFPEIGDPDPLIPQDAREQALIDLLKAKTVAEIVDDEVRRASEPTEAAVDTDH
jgi:hypothetical protein